MRLRFTAVVLPCLLLAGALRAQDAEKLSAPPPTDLRLLNTVPNYAEILRHQWSSGVPQDVIQAETSNQMYGGQSLLRSFSGADAAFVLPSSEGRLQDRAH